MLKAALHLLLEKTSLSQEEAKDAMRAIMQGANPHQIAAYLSLLKSKGETAEEIAGMAQALKDNALKIVLPFPVFDIVGTGGDGARTVNISTGASILIASCGIPVVKHGNRSISSLAGSADVLEALHISIEVPPHEVERSLHEAMIAFLFAPYYHPSLKTLKSLRKSLPFPTVLNALGPLLNPAHAEYALIGVAQPTFLEPMAQAILQLGRIKRALVFHGSGLDELTTLGPITAYEINEQSKQLVEINPGTLGFHPCTLADLQGGDAQHNAHLLKEVFSGKPGALADTLVLNAAAALYIFGRIPSIKEGIPIARAALKEGKALETLEKWAAFKPQNYLDAILAKKHEQVNEKLYSNNFSNCSYIKHTKKKTFALSIKQNNLSVIAEIKRRSPSRGPLRDISDPVQLALEYCKGGAAAISVLTDSHFDGDIYDLKCVAQALELAYPHVPILRKDFIVHPMQLLESLQAGADAVLLIAKVLKKDLKFFIKEAHRLGLETLIEVHDEEDLHLAVSSGAPIIGINHRNLETFAIDLHTSHILRPMIPSSIITVAESGIMTSSDAISMRTLRYDAILVGEALVCSDNPSALIAQMRGICS